ncbi:fructose transport system substrate-binding protein [Neorhizobium galegae]|uniref:substrate-binding domain-containing protein n=1 Tax=Neorhizobium galegae TaxID=399 RepID=UPI001AE588AD|nr:substrate-binding domain-containing protein [Neorhizobium galegae]MBP2551203.1 fructose transport system substrate-binding protein [Neorhizobium galegae]
MSQNCSRTPVRAHGLKLGVAALGLVIGASFGAGQAAAEDVIVGLVTKTEVNPFFAKMRQAAEARAKEKKVKLIARAGKFDGDNEGQVAAIEDLISAGAKGILVTPNNSSGMLGVIKKARAAGVLVIALDTATDPADAVDATFATDNFEAGVQQGTYARKAMGDKKAVVAMLDGTPGGTVDTFRHDGYLKGFGIKAGDPSIAGAAITNGAQDKGQVGMENLLSKNGDINAVYTINEPAAAGAFAALKSFGKEKDVMLTSIDGGCAGVRDVKDGKIAATVMQFPYKMASMGVDAVVEYAATGKKPSGFVNTGSFLITDKPVQGLESKDTAWGLKNCWGD